MQIRNKLMTLILTGLLILVSISNPVSADEVKRTFATLEPIDEQAIEAAMRPTAYPMETSVSLGMVGEVLMHDWVLNGGLQEDGTYDYDYIFEYLKPELAKLDYSIANMEGTLAGPPYAGYPLFSAPDEIARAIAVNGFDMAITSNNHMLDRGVDGLDQTLKVLQDAGLETVGSSLSTDIPTYVMKDLNGIKVGFSAYTYETVRQGEFRGLNGIPMPHGLKDRFDSFSQENDLLEAEAEIMQQRVRDMREEGAELVVFLMHWGTEYTVSEDWYSQYFVQKLADAGCDLVFSSGPHVIWPIKSVKATDSDHELLCFYSSGNIVSDQYYDTGNSYGRTEDGLLCLARYERDAAGNISLAEVGYIATYCSKTKLSENSSRNRVVPVEAAIAYPAAYRAESVLNLLTASRDRTAIALSPSEVSGLEIQSFAHVPDEWANP